MFKKFIVSFLVGTTIGTYGMNHGWTPAELVFLCIPIGILIGVAFNARELIK